MAVVAMAVSLVWRAVVSSASSCEGMARLPRPAVFAMCEAVGLVCGEESGAAVVGEDVACRVPVVGRLDQDAGDRRADDGGGGCVESGETEAGVEDGLVGGGL
jgi:hypothetical protein